MLTKTCFVGRKILELQASLTLVHGPSSARSVPTEDEYGRMPFQHTALEGLHGLSAGENAKYRFLNKDKVAQLAENYGLDAVARWKPKSVRCLLPTPVSVKCHETNGKTVGEEQN